MQLSCSAVLFGISEAVFVWVYNDVSCSCIAGNMTQGDPYCSHCEQTTLTGSGDQPVSILTATVAIQQVIFPHFICHLLTTVQIVDSATTIIQLQGLYTQCR